MTGLYDLVGYGSRKIGFGRWPCVVVIDFQVGFTRPEYKTGRSTHIHRAVENTSKLLDKARAHGVPVASCNVSWASERDMAHWKVSELYQDMFIGAPSIEMDSRVYDPSYDFNFVKAAPSMFFGTPLVTFLMKQNVDTVIVTGCVTSGCVRATINDSFSYGFRTIVPEDCVGDMDEGPHKANLLDVQRRYADVVQMSEVLEHFDKVGKKQNIAS